MNNNSNIVGDDDYSNLGKRARFMNLMKNTKDTYFPAISQSFKNSTSTVWDHTKNAPPYHYKEFPNDMQLVFYPTYTTNVFGGFETRIRFSLQSPGNITSRRNRLLVALSKQYLKPGSNVTTPPSTISPGSSSSSSSSGDEFESTLLDMDNLDDRLSGSTPTTMSRHDSESSYTPIDPDSNELDVLKERLTGFITKSVGNVPLTITLFNNDEDKEFTTHLQSDSKGHMDEKFNTEFLPTNVKISLDHNQSLDFTMDLTETYPITYIKPEGVAVISDIDDTIKHTGITGDKRSMFRNVFVHDIESWSIKDIPEWYNHLKTLYDADFFYVSNSPMQLYSVLKDYITKNLPMGPMFLKQYSGNLLSGIMTSSANRKLNSIKDIISDFSNRKFILIGDSGEQDLEAYISTAIRYPDQIVAIYIRCCKNSMSDMGLNENGVMNELNDLVHYEYVKPFQVYHSNETLRDESISPPLPPRPTIPRKKFDLTTSQMSSIKLSKLNLHHQSNSDKNGEPCLSGSESSNQVSPQSSSPLPMLSNRSASTSPQELHIHNTAPTIRRRVPPPPLPFHLEKPHTDTEILEHQPGLGSHLSYYDKSDDTKPDYMMPSNQNDNNTYSGYFDKKAEAWNKRVKQSLNQLNDIGKYDLRIMFFSDPKVAEKDSIARINDITK